MGRYPGPGWTDQPAVIFSDQPARGRWVVVQKNSPGVLNIAEIYVSTDKISKYQLKGQFSFNIHSFIQFISLPSSKTDNVHY